MANTGGDDTMEEAVQEEIISTTNETEIEIDNASIEAEDTMQPIEIDNTSIEQEKTIESIEIDNTNIEPQKAIESVEMDNNNVEQERTIEAIEIDNTINIEEDTMESIEVDTTVVAEDDTIESIEIDNPNTENEETMESVTVDIKDIVVSAESPLLDSAVSPLLDSAESPLLDSAESPLLDSAESPDPENYEECREPILQIKLEEESLESISENLDIPSQYPLNDESEFREGEFKVETESVLTSLADTFPVPQEENITELSTNQLNESKEPSGVLSNITGFPEQPDSTLWKRDAITKVPESDIKESPDEPDFQEIEPSPTNFYDDDSMEVAENEMSRDSIIDHLDETIAKDDDEEEEKCPQPTFDSRKEASEDGEDLEEGEIEEDEDDVPEVQVTENDKSKSVELSPTSSSSSKDKSKSHHHQSSSSKDKDRESKKNKGARESKPEKKRKHSTDSGERSPTHREKLSKRRHRRSEDGTIGEDEDYLFVRGVSVSPPPPLLGLNPLNSLPPLSMGRKIYETDPFGHPIYEDELEADFPASPSAKRRRRSRTPPSLGDRRKREEIRPRRPTSGRKDTIKPLHKSDQICAYYMQGKCQKSHEECSFSHNAVPPRKMELCKFWMMDCCAKKEKCLYLHNDFPCKYYHTGLVCKDGIKNQCKFSHKPMNEVTKAVLLKHIESAPKEILGDFPRLNRQGALSLMAKMESRINAELKRQERDRDEDRRRSRWEQPTRADEEKLQELMEEAGLGNYYQETVEGKTQQSGHPIENSQHMQRNHDFHERLNDRKPYQPNTQQPPSLRGPHPSSLGVNSLLGMLPNQIPPLIPPQPHVINNPALANVLATLQIPSSTIKRPDEDRREDRSFDRPQVSPLSPNLSGENELDLRREKSDMPDNLPPMQRGIFRRIQEQQLKNEKRMDSGSDDEKPTDDAGWYSSDEETDKPLTEVLKEIPEEKKEQNKPVVDFASVLSAIRKTTVAASGKSEALNSGDSKLRIQDSDSPIPSFPGRGDVDFRIGGGGVNSIALATPSSPPQGPFRGDTDFRVKPVRQEFRDVDLRMNNSPPEKRHNTSPPLFKSLPTGPATMIDAAINSHPPIHWKVRIVAGVKPPDYSYIKHTLTLAQLALDPRFGTRTGGGGGLLPDPTSPPHSSHTVGTLPGPPSIPGGETMLDPRINRRAGPSGSGSRLAPDPRLGGDPRSGGSGHSGPNLMAGWPPSVEMTQAALAAQLLAAQQLGLLPFPNPSGHPLVPPNFPPGGNTTRPPFASPRNSTPPASSWERYSQQKSGGVTPPL